MLMKYMFIALILFMLPLVNAHRLFGFWVADTGEHTPIENHLSDNALRVLETAVDATATKHCHDSRCEKGVLGYISHIFGFIMDRLD